MTRILPLVLLAACAPTPTRLQAPGGPRGLRASEHMDAARVHEEDARRQPTVWAPENASIAPGAATPEPSATWHRTWNPGEHARLAEIHRSHASELYAEYADWCADLPPADVSTSPLERYGVGGSNTSVGVILYLAPGAGPAERMLLEMKCHRAWMMLAPASMEDCPLDLPNITLDARGDATGITVSIVTQDPKLVPELQRRAAKELEHAATRRAQQRPPQ